MADHFDDLGGAAGADLAVDALDEVEGAGPKFPAPPLVADAVVPEGGTGEGRVWKGSVADEAAGGVSVEGKEEGDEEVVSVPEGFVRLLSDLGVGGGVHQEHAKEHDVTCDAAGLRVVDLDCGQGSYLGPLNVEKAVMD